MGIKIGPITTRNNVFLAPMSGVSDEPFRAAAHAGGAGLVVSEMVASDALAGARPDMVKRARGRGKVWPFCIQLAGREARWMAEGARLAQDLGADLIDINMGCPARQVTGGLSGSALMRDLDHALTLVEATVAAAKVPVTLKMRLGWDHGQLNAPDLARRAAAAGVQMVTIHGRTRCQFYGGRADWSAIRAVKDNVSIPVIANGDCATGDDARAMLKASGADGVMIGRGSYGRPWWPGVIAEALEAGTGRRAPNLAEEAGILAEQHRALLSLHGARGGNKVARKHLGWAIERKAGEGRIAAADALAWKARIQSSEDNAFVAASLAEFFDLLQEREAMAA